MTLFFFFTFIFILHFLSFIYAFFFFFVAANSEGKFKAVIYTKSSGTSSPITNFLFPEVEERRKKI